MKLSTLIETSRDYELGKISEQEYIDFLNDVYVNGSIPLKKKIMSVMNVLFDFDYDDDDIFNRYMQLEMNKFWYIMLKYTDIELEEEYITEENYELLFPLIYKSIKGIAGIDFDYTMNLLNEMKNDIEHDGIIHVFEELSNTDFGELIEADSNLIKDLKNNQDFINNLVQVFNHVNPNVGQINKKIEQSIIKEINKTKE